MSDRASMGGASRTRGALGAGRVQAQVAGWFIRYDNRIVGSTVPLQGGGTINIDCNVGAVVSKGVDASVTVNPMPWLSVYASLPTSNPS